MNRRNLLGLSAGLFLAAVALLSVRAVLADDGGAAKSERRAAFKVCAAETGVKFKDADGNHIRPSRDDRHKLQACLAEKGVKIDFHALHKHHKEIKACMSAKGVSLPKRDADGNRPAPDEAMKKAFRECRQQVKGVNG